MPVSWKAVEHERGSDKKKIVVSTPKDREKGLGKLKTKVRN